MKIAIVGATGPSGQELVKEALTRGHQVVALVRNPDKLIQQNDNLQVSKVDIYKEEELSPHLRGCDAALSALGYNGGFFSRVTLYEDTIKPITGAMRTANVSRFACITSWCTESEPGNPKFMEWFVKPLFIGHMLKSMARMERYLLSTDINYTIVRPQALVNQSTEDRELKALEGQFVPNCQMVAKVSRGHMAKFILDCLITDTWDKKVVVIST